MITSYEKKAAFGLAGAVLFLSGCNSSNTADNSALMTITSTNATDTIASAVASTNQALTDVPVAAEAAHGPSVLDILKLSDNLAEKDTGVSLVSTPTGIRMNDSCNNGNGSFTNDYSSTPASKSGSISLTGCTLFGVTLNGDLSYSLDWTDSGGPYTYEFMGNLTSQWNNITTTIRNLDYSVTGDNMTGDYSVNKFDHSVSFANGRGYTVTLLTPITGNESNNPACPTAGAVLVTGAIGTQARGTIDYPNVNIDYDDGSGTFTPVETVPCTDIFPIDRPFLLRNQI